MTDITSMFDSIKGSLSNDNKSTGNGGNQNIMRLKPGNTYLVRLIPNIKNPAETFLNYSHHGWTSTSTGQYVDALCPRTFGERCLLCEERFKLYKKADGDKSSRYYKLFTMLRDHEKSLVNVYVVNDPTNEDNNGTVKVLRLSKTLKAKVDLAVTGDDADEFGSKVFDLSDEGCNFKIVVETTQDGKNTFQNYNNSRFTSSSAIPNMTKAKIKEVYESIFDLNTFIERKSTEELKQMLIEHVYGEDVPPVSSNTKPGLDFSKFSKSAEVEDEDEEEDEPKQKSVETKKSSGSKKSKIDELLEGLDDPE